MPRLIDADTVVTIQVYDDMTEEWDLKKMTIAEAIDRWSDEGCPPTVDAKPVVRCKDCIHSGQCFKEIIMQRRIGSYLYCPLGDNGYCSLGERKEDGETN